MFYILCAFIPALVVYYATRSYYKNQRIEIVERNKVMEEENSRIQQENNQLSFQNSKLIQENEKIEELNKEYIDLQNNIDHQTQNLVSLSAQKQTLMTTLAEIDAQIQTSRSTAATAAESFYQSELAAAKERLNLTLLLEQSKYKKAIEEAEKNFNTRQETITSTITDLEEELNNIQSKYNAAIEEARRKEEMETKIDFYRIQIPEEEQNEINALLSIKHLISNKRNLYMLIWTSYYSKRVNELAVRVLGSKPISGIYRITNIQTQQMYVGQARDVRERWRDHIKNGLGIDTPSSTKLYPNMMKYGIENFTFELLEACADTTKLNEKEHYWIEFFDTYNNGLNSNRGISK